LPHFMTNIFGNAVSRREKAFTETNLETMDCALIEKILPTVFYPADIIWNGLFIDFL